MVVAGTALGHISGCALAAVGLGALITASATTFAALKLGGAAYLIGLGVRMWRAAAAPTAQAAAMRLRPAHRIFAHAYLTSVLKPKPVLFFMVFLPQFIDPGRALPPQLAVMLPTVLLAGGLIDSGYSLSAGAVRRLLRTPRSQARLTRACGGSLVGEGVVAMTACLAVR